MLLVRTESPQQTFELGRRLGQILLPGDLVCLEGDLGTGKTCLAGGIARGLGVTGYVSSPSFNIVNEYEGRFPVYHIDVYRLEDPAELEEIGYRDYFFGTGVTVVEWADKIKELVPDECLWIRLVRPPGGEVDHREITIHAVGDRYRCRIERMKTDVGAGP